MYFYNYIMLVDVTLKEHIYQPINQRQYIFFYKLYLKKKLYLYIYGVTERKKFKEVKHTSIK